MDELESIIGGHEEQEPDTSTIVTVPSTSTGSAQWCSSCRNLANKFEEKFLSNFIALKQKIFFTDNLIKVHQDTKRELEEVTKKYHQAIKSKNLMQSQLQLLLSKEQPSFSDAEKLQARNQELERMVEELEAQMLALDESRKLHEDTIKVLRSEDTAKVNDLKKKYSQQISELKKELSVKNEENKKVHKKNKELLKRIEGLRKRKNAQKNTDDITGLNPAKVQIMSTEASAAFEKEGKVAEKTKVVAAPKEIPSVKKLIENENREVSKSTGDELRKHDRTDDTNETDKNKTVRISSVEAPPKPKKLSHVQKLELENENRIAEFQRQPTRRQTKELAALARDFRTYFIKHQRKKVSMDFLLRKAAEFSAKHSIEPRDDVVMVKLLELNRPVLEKNKKVLSRVREAIAVTTEAQDETIPVGERQNAAKDMTNSSQSSDKTQDGATRQDDQTRTVEMEDTTMPADRPGNTSKKSSETSSSSDSLTSSDESTTVNRNRKFGDLNLNFNGTFRRQSESETTSFDVYTTIHDDVVVDTESTPKQTEARGERKESFTSVMPDLCLTTEPLSIQESGKFPKGFTRKTSSIADGDNMGSFLPDTTVSSGVITSPTQEFRSVMPILDSEIMSPTLSDSHDTLKIRATTEKANLHKKVVNEEETLKNGSESITTDENPLKRKLSEPTTPKKETETAVPSDWYKTKSKRIRTRSMTASSSSEIDDTFIVLQRKKRTSRIKDVQRDSAIRSKKIVSDDYSIDEQAELGEKKTAVTQPSKTIANEANFSHTSSTENSLEINETSTEKESTIASDLCMSDTDSSVADPLSPSRIQRRSLFQPQQSYRADVYPKGTVAPGKEQSRPSIAPSKKDTTDKNLLPIALQTSSSLPTQDYHHTQVTAVECIATTSEETLHTSSKNRIQKASISISEVSSKTKSVSSLIEQNQTNKIKRSTLSKTVMTRSLMSSVSTLKGEHSRIIQKHSSKIETGSVSSVETDSSIDLSDIFSEMLLPMTLLSPLKTTEPVVIRGVLHLTEVSHDNSVSDQEGMSRVESVSDKIESSSVKDVSETVGLPAVEKISHLNDLSRVDCPVDPESSAFVDDDDSRHDETDDSKAKSLISPSTDLCTAISFNTPKKKVKRKEEDIVSSPAEITKDTAVNKASYKKVQIMKKIHSSTDLESDKDGFRPRRFSCEAPERAVNVPPIKPSSSGTLPDIKLPSLSESESGKTFPQYRKETDIPSHWHANVSLPIFVDPGKIHNVADTVDVNIQQSAMGENNANSQGTPDSLCEKCVSKLENVVSTPVVSEKHMVVHGGNEAVEEDIIGAVKKNADSSKSDHALVIDTHSHDKHTDTSRITDSSKSDDACIIDTDSNGKDIDATSHDNANTVDRKEEPDSSKSEDMDLRHSDTNDNVATNNEVQYNASTDDDDADLVMDITDDPAFIDSVTSPEIDIPMVSARALPSQDEDLKTKSHDSDGCRLETSPVLKSFQDLRELMTRKNSLKKLAVIDDSFVLDGIVRILKNCRSANVDVLAHLSESVCDVAISHLSLCEQKFLKKIRVLQLSGVIHKYAIVNDVIPVFLHVFRRVHSQPARYDSKKHRWSNPGLVQLTPFLSSKTGSLNEAGLSALLRVFFFVCKTAKVFSPVVHVCRYHVLARRSSNLIVAIVEGLICWPQVLLYHERFGKILLNVISRECSSPHVGKQKKIYLLERVKFLYHKVGWKRFANVTSLHEEVLNGVMSALESTKFSMELEEILSDDNPDTSRSLTILDKSLYLDVYTLEMYPNSLITQQIISQVLHGRFWPILQTWSKHLHFYGDTKDKSVSNATIVGILESFAHMLFYYLLKQRQNYKDQPTLPHMQEHFQTICHLLDNLSIHYADKSPRMVRCTVAAFILKTCYCNPTLAYSTLLKWAKSFGDSSNSGNKESDMKLTALMVGSGLGSMRRICEWLDRSCFGQEDSLVKLLWPD